MKTYVDLRYIDEFFSEWEMFQTEVVEEIKTHSSCIFFSSKVVPFMR